MADLFADSLTDFDLNFLNHVPENNEAQKKAKKLQISLHKIKKKVTNSSSLVAHCKDTKTSLEETEKALFASKEECKQMCLDYMSLSERQSQLENENKALIHRTQELHRKCLETQGQFGAMQSYTNQLQMLVKEKEDEMAALKLENKLVKSTVSKEKRQITILKRKNSTLLQNITTLKHFLFSKKKVHNWKHELKSIFNKFDPVETGQITEDSDSEEEHNTADWNDVSNSPNPQDDTPMCGELLQFKKDARIYLKGTDNDEVFSIDTGRGSSLAYSDSEKCFQSPEYFLNSPGINYGTRQKSAATSPLPVHSISTPTSPIKMFNQDTIDKTVSGNQFLTHTEVTVPVVAIDKALSPILFAEPTKHTTEIATSPIIFEMYKNHRAVSPIMFAEPEKHANEMASSPILFEAYTVHRALSPIMFAEPKKCTIEIATSPIFFEVSISDTSLDSDIEIVDENVEGLLSENNKSPEGFKGFSNDEICCAHKEIKTLKEKLCLKINNSNIVCDLTSDDEIEMILNDIKYSMNNIVTPIPMTPDKQRTPEKPNNIETIDVDSVIFQQAQTEDKVSILAKRIIHLQKRLEKIEGQHVSHDDEPIPTSSLCLDSQFEYNNDYVEIVETPGIDQPIESCNATQPKENLNAALSVQKSKSSPNKHKANVTKKAATPVHSVNTLINQIEFEDGPRFSEQLSVTQNHHEGSSTSISRRNSEKINDDPSKHNVRAALNNSTLTEENAIEGQKSKEKSRKLTRLEKMRKKLEPKYKIKEAVSPLKRSPRLNASNVSTIIKVLNFDNRTKKVVTDQDSAATLNNKDVYEKAVKVMAELKSHQTEKITIKKVDKNIRSPRDGAASNTKQPAKAKNNDVISSHGANNKDTTRDQVHIESDNDTIENINTEKRIHRKCSARAKEQDFTTKSISTPVKNSKSHTNNEVNSSVTKNTHISFDNNINSEHIQSDYDSIITRHRRLCRKDSTSDKALDHKSTNNSIPGKNNKSILNITKGDLCSPVYVHLVQLECDDSNTTKERRTCRNRSASVYVVDNKSKNNSTPIKNNKCKNNESYSPVTNNDDNVHLVPLQSDYDSNTTKDRRICRNRSASDIVLDFKSKNNSTPTKNNKSLVNNNPNNELYSPVTTKKRTAIDDNVQLIPLQSDYDSNTTKDRRICRNRSASDNVLDFKSKNNSTPTKNNKTLVHYTNNESDSPVTNNLAHIQPNYDCNKNITKEKRRWRKSSASEIELNFKSKCLFSHEKNNNETLVNKTDVTPTITNNIKTIRNNIESDDFFNTMANEKRAARKRSASEKELNPTSKRILRSSTRQSQSEHPETAEPTQCSQQSQIEHAHTIEPMQCSKKLQIEDTETIETTQCSVQSQREHTVAAESTQCSHPKYSLLCRTIETHAHMSGKKYAQKYNESVINDICQKIEDGIAHVNELPSEQTKQALKTLTEELCAWELKFFLAGLIKYLKNPQRKVELFNKINLFPAPPMSKSESTLVYILIIMEFSNPWKEKCLIYRVLDAMEYALFQLNHTPDFDVIESMSHFYAILCRFKQAKSRLRLFVIDAMYCLQYKSIPLIKQCIEVWMHILPLAHMAEAKKPLVICLVYLLHFYKCDDRFHRVSDIRTVLQKKYFFNITDWNDNKILEMFKKSLMQVNNILVERKMLRMAFIILSKRNGPNWCHNNIISKLLLPLIDGVGIPQKTKEFCASMLGPLIRPFPKNMKAHCDIVISKLLNILNQNPTPQMEEAVFGSLLYVYHMNFNRIMKQFISWNPLHVSSEFEKVLIDTVQSKPLKQWKDSLSKVLN